MADACSETAFAAVARRSHSKMVRPAYEFETARPRIA
jgi:hypothetical protein